MELLDRLRELPASALDAEVWVEVPLVAVEQSEPTSRTDVAVDSIRYERGHVLAATDPVLLSYEDY